MKQMKKNCILSLIVFVVLGGCTSTDMGSPSSLLEPRHKVTLLLKSHTPYCGGAKPNAINQKGYTQPLDSMILIVQRKNMGDISTQKMWKIISDQNGHVDIMIPNGEYWILFEDKIHSLDSFYNKSIAGLSSYFQPMDVECFQKWQQTPESRFEVQSDTTLTLTLKKYCHTGFNPCLLYIGPKPK